ncbi:MAG: HD domain-containing protein [Candidatus Hydrothermarchaeales archaeon]
MYERKLTDEEKEYLKQIVEFVKEKHAGSEGHDYSHVLHVTELAMEIAEKIPEKADPFLIATGALLHDIGRVNRESGTFHGLEGAAIAEEYLEATGVDFETMEKITRIIVRHTPTSMIPPESIEEKAVFDADTLDRQGWMGVLRGLLGKRGSIEEIFDYVIKKRKADYDKLKFDVSKEMGKEDHKELEFLVDRMEKALEERKKELEIIEFLEMKNVV